MVRKELLNERDSSMKRGLYVLRAQPLHLGHLKVIKSVLEEVDELIIVVGSAQINYEQHNPFTAGERITMIKLALDEAGVDPSRYYVIPVPDVFSHKTWAMYVISYVPSFSVVYSNNPTVTEPFRDIGYKIKPVPYYNRKEYSSTKIRRRILAGERWDDLVPPSVAKYIRSIRGDKRIKAISKTSD